jgi:hypothetical protein
MKNRHRLECPIDCAELPSYYRWIAIDSNGEVYAYENKPRVINGTWNAVDFYFWQVGETSQPNDFTKCLWKRTKSKCNCERI